MAMLTGEPYISNYLEFMDMDVRAIATVNNADLVVNDLIPEHVRVWNLSVNRPLIMSASSDPES